MSNPVTPHGLQVAGSGQRPNRHLVQRLKNSDTISYSTRVPTCRYRGRAPAIKKRASTRNIARRSFLTTTSDSLLRETHHEGSQGGIRKAEDSPRAPIPACKTSCAACTSRRKVVR